MANTDVPVVAGVFMAAKEFNFWSLYQGFEYHYEQVVNRMTESCWGKPFIIPGCIFMVNASHCSAIKASKEFQNLPSSNNIFEINDRMQGTDRRHTNCLLKHSPAGVNLLVTMEMKCFTKPPQNLKHFASQRRRWMSNAISGYIFVLFGGRSSVGMRSLATLELISLHLCAARLVCLLNFMLNITESSVPILSLLVVPYIFFIVHVLAMASNRWFLCAGSVAGVLVSPFINIYIFVNCLINFTNASWGITHGKTQ